MRRVLGLLFVAALWCEALFAQSKELNYIDLKAEFRIDYAGEYFTDKSKKGLSGFECKYINIQLSGDISNSFSYAYRQRLNKFGNGRSFFDATDWLYLTYTTPNRRWSLSAGKLVVGIGGYEYDRAPINLYFCSEFWNNIACYQLGASVTYTSRSGHDKILFQVCESPFRQQKHNMFAYNAMWMGSHSWFSALYSLNVMEYMPSKYLCYVALGNEFRLGSVGRLQLDVMSRGTNGKSLLFEDFSVMGELAFNIGKMFTAFGKVTYDKNTSGLSYDACVMPDTEVTRLGVGIECYPLPNQNRAVRLHAAYCHTLGRNSNPAGVLLGNQSLFMVGVTWSVDLISLTKKIIK